MSPKPGANILLFEDDPTVAELNTLILEHEGHSVTTYADGRKGLKRFLAAPDTYDVVLLDIIMPGLPGEEILREIHHARPDVPVLLCSGSAPDASLRDAIDGKGVGFLKKPYDANELLAQLHRLTEPREKTPHAQ